MGSHRADDERLELLLRAIKARIDRFYWEGSETWSRASVEGHLRGEADINDPRVQEEFCVWEQIGVIKRVGTDDRYFEVLRPFSQVDDEYLE